MCFSVSCPRHWLLVSWTTTRKTALFRKKLQFEALQHQLPFVGEGRRTDLFKSAANGLGNKQFVRSYLSLFTETNQYYTDEGLSISRSDYGGRHTLFVFDLTPDHGSAADQWELVKHGNLRLEVRSGKALTTINAIVYAEFDNPLEITATKTLFSITLPEHEHSTNWQYSAQRSVRSVSVSWCVRSPQRVGWPATLVWSLDTGKNPGLHWLVVYIDSRRGGYYFDSYSSPPPCKKIENFLNHNCIWWNFNRTTLQAPFSAVCGQYFIYVLLYMCRGEPMRAIVSRFLRVVVENDRAVAQFASTYLC